MAEGVKKGYSGIGGQAVLEGVMMKNGEKYAVAVKKPDGNITVEVEHYAGILRGSPLKKVPFVRVSGISCNNCFGLTDKHKRGEIYETGIGNCKMRIGMLSLF